MDREMLEECLDDMEKDRKAEEERYRNPDEALALLTRAISRWNEQLDDDQSKLPQVVKVLEVLDVQVGTGFRESSTSIRARAIRAVDNVEDIIEFDAWSDSGSREEPPSHEENIIWENLDDDGYAIEWEHLYTIKRPEQPVTMETCARKNKVEYLHNAIRKGGVRARIHEGQLQYNKAQKAEMYRAIAMHIVNLKPFHNLFNGATLS